MSIFDFSVEQIVKSYLDYINKMQEINLTVASSYLVMASELIELKSRELLPKHEEEEEEEDGDVVSKEALAEDEDRDDDDEMDE